MTFAWCPFCDLMVATGSEFSMTFAKAVLPAERLAARWAVTYKNHNTRIPHHMYVYICIYIYIYIWMQMQMHLRSQASCMFTLIRLCWRIQLLLRALGLTLLRDLHPALPIDSHCHLFIYLQNSSRCFSFAAGCEPPPPFFADPVAVDTMNSRTVTNTKNTALHMMSACTRHSQQVIYIYSYINICIYILVCVCTYKHIYIYVYALDPGRGLG